jgi:hypothetical protein
MTRHIIPISGKDSLATALLQTARQPELEYEYIFCDVGAELPETYAWLEKVEQKTGWKINRIGKNLESIIAKYNLLPSFNRRFCTREAKIAPLERFHKTTGEVFVYYGLRADENRTGVRPSDTTKQIYPLKDAGIDLRGVWLILKNQDLLPPNFFWNAVYYRVCEILGENWKILDELPEWLFQFLFAGRTRSNCYFCFFQAQFELVWLLDTHPDLFWRGAWIERFTGGDLTDFHWRQDYYWSDKIITDRQKILDRRAKGIIKFLKKYFNRDLFGLEFDFDNEIAQTSCGLLCGK